MIIRKQAPIRIPQILMHDHSSSHPHPLLVQLPLSVSPFIHLPTGITLPYTYQTLPHTLPPPSTAPPPPINPQEPPPAGYITSPSGTFSTTPEAIIASCQGLIVHLAEGRKAAEEKVREWEKGIEDRELMEKRRIAPGYLDTGVTMLTPVKLGLEKPEENGKTREVVGGAGGGAAMEGEELDRIFGSMGL